MFDKSIRVAVRNNGAREADQTDSWSRVYTSPRITKFARHTVRKSFLTYFRHGCRTRFRFSPPGGARGKFDPGLSPACASHSRRSSINCVLGLLFSYFPSCEPTGTTNATRYFRRVPLPEDRSADKFDPKLRFDTWSSRCTRARQ